MPEKDVNLWGYVATGITSIVGMLGLQGLIIRGQNQKVKEMCDETKLEIAEIKVDMNLKTDSKWCEHLHGELKDDMREIANTLKEISRSQQSMDKKIALLGNGRKRVLDG